MKQQPPIDEQGLDNTNSTCTPLIIACLALQSNAVASAHPTTKSEWELNSLTDNKESYLFLLQGSSQ